MKKIQLLFILWIFAYPLVAQNAVHITGTVTSVGNGMPVPNHEVIIQTDSMYGSYYYHVVVTNPNGFYSDYIPVEPAGSSGLVHITTYDCQQYANTFNQTYGPGVTSLVQNFVICYFSTQTCTANYTYETTGLLTKHFHDISVNNTAVRLWDFGDGTASTAIDLYHTFPSNGQYPVKLVIGFPGSACWDSITLMVEVGDSVPCQAYFHAEADNQNPLLIHFINQSTGPFLASFNWDFGDGSVVVTTPNNPNVDHLYASAGSYVACLTASNPGVCQNTFCQTIVVGQPQGCEADYTYEPIGPLAFHFHDISVGSGGVRLWNFGDGTTSSNIDPVHTFPAPGVYPVILTIGSPNTACTDTEIKNIMVGDSIATGCQAYFHTEQSTQVPFLVYFNNLSTGNIAQFVWDFGDGTSTTINFPSNPNVDHQYVQAGTYYACLTVHGNDSLCADTYCALIEVGGSTPICHAVFSYAPIANNPHVIQFTDLSSSSAGAITAWSWQFGDGTGSSNQNPDHLYANFGTYTVCLTITTANGCTSNYCHEVEVENVEGCQAYYTFAPVPGTSPNTIQFTDASMSSGVISWFWNFDDGTTSTEQNPIHVFPSGPVIDPYFVCLTITRIDSSCTDTYCHPFIPENEGCHAEFEVHHNPNSNLSIYFEDQSEGDIWMWVWNFGDGTSDTILNPANPNIMHTYQAQGFYNVCLTIQGDMGACLSTYCETIAVGDSLPGCQAQFTYYPDSTNTGNVMHFVDLSAGNPTSWFWNFGDPASGTNNTSTLQNPTFSFTSPGTYYVCLTVHGPSCESTWCSEIEVGAGPNCVNYFTYESLGLSTHFEGHLLNGAPATYVWDFGDNQSGTGENIIHTYNAPGVYFVNLTTLSTNPPGGCIYSSGQLISVGDTTIWHQVYGQVFAGNFPVQQGLVMLFSMDTSNYFVPFVSVSTLDSLGVYYFPMVPQGNFYIYAIPFTSGYLPTYYGDVLNWGNASVITLGTPDNPYNIHLIEGDGFVPGSCNIQGQLVQGDISDGLVDKVTMLLKDQNGNVIQYSQVNNAGEFSFPQLSYGTYFLYAELAGCESQTIKIVLSESNPASQVVMAIVGKSIMGNNENIPGLVGGIVYPNPVKDNARITVNLNEMTEVTLEIYNMAGQLTYQNHSGSVSGETTLTIPTANLTPGIYTLKLYTSEGLILTRKLVKSN